MSKPSSLGLRPKTADGAPERVFSRTRAQASREAALKPGRRWRGVIPITANAGVALSDQRVLAINPNHVARGPGGPDNPLPEQDDAVAARARERANLRQQDH